MHYKSKAIVIEIVIVRSTGCTGCMCYVGVHLCLEQYMAAANLHGICIPKLHSPQVGLPGEPSCFKMCRVSSHQSIQYRLECIILVFDVLQRHHQSVRGFVAGREQR